MTVGQTLRPGQRGTHRWVTTYGDQLVAVRYRYDAERQRRMTTVELIVSEGPWSPAPKPDPMVGVRVEWGEVEVARQVKRSGGEWDRQRRVWRLARSEAARLGLDGRVVELEGHPMGRRSPRLETGR